MALYLPILTALLAGVGLARRRDARWPSRPAPITRHPGGRRCGTAGWSSAFVVQPSEEVLLLKVLGLDPAGRRASPRSCRSRRRSARSWSASRCPAAVAHTARVRADPAARPVRRGVLRLLRPADRPGRLPPVVGIAAGPGAGRDQPAHQGRAPACWAARPGRARASPAGSGPASPSSPGASSTSSSPAWPSRPGSTAHLAPLAAAYVLHPGHHRSADRPRRRPSRRRLARRKAKARARAERQK